MKPQNNNDQMVSTYDYIIITVNSVLRDVNNILISEMEFDITH